MGFQCKIVKMAYLTNGTGISSTKLDYYPSLCTNINSKRIEGSGLD